MNFVLTNIKNILLVVIVVNWYVLMTSKPFKWYLGKDAYDFISNAIEETNYCSDVKKKHFNEELLMNKADDKDFKKSTKSWICFNDYIYCDVRVSDHCHMTRKYRGISYRDCNNTDELNHELFVVFHNLKNYDSHLILQELAKFNLKLNVISNVLEKYMSFNINNKLSFIDSFHFLSSS